MLKGLSRILHLGRLSRPGFTAGFASSSVEDRVSEVQRQVRCRAREFVHVLHGESASAQDVGRRGGACRNTQPTSDKQHNVLVVNVDKAHARKSSKKTGSMHGHTNVIRHPDAMTTSDECSNRSKPRSVQKKHPGFNLFAVHARAVCRADTRLVQ